MSTLPPRRDPGVKPVTPTTGRPDLPQPSAVNFQQRTREVLMTLMGRQGNQLDRAITLRDLVAGGLAYMLPGGGIVFKGGPGSAGVNWDDWIGGGGPPADVYEPDLTPPPTPTGLAVSAAISHVFIEHDPAVYTQGHGHLRTRVYGVVVEPGDPLPTFADAVELGQFTGTMWPMPSDPALTWHLWIKWESIDGVLSASPAGGTNGAVTTTGYDVTRMVEAMTGPGNPFTVLANPTTIDGVLFPAGTYSTMAFIIDAQITNAKIANLAVDDAKIASLSVGKLTSGSLDVGEYIQSSGYVPGVQGFRFNGDGTGEMSSITVRGAVYAAAGAIGGAQIGTSFVRSSNYVANTAGWMLDNAAGKVYAMAGNIGGMSIEGQRTVVRTATTMIVTGAPFGSTNQFIQWTGPLFSSLSSCTEANAISYTTVNGDAYFAGSLSAGTLKNAATTTSLAANASVLVGPFSTNGDTKTIVVSYSYSRSFSCNHGTGGASGSGSATVILERSVNGGAWTTLTTLSASGTPSVYVDPDPGAVDIVSFGMSASVTVTDNTAATTDMQLRATITARTLPSLAGTNKQSNITTQNVSVVSTEQ